MNLKNNGKLIVKAKHFSTADYRVVSLWSRQRFDSQHQFEFRNKIDMFYESVISDIDTAIFIIMTYGAEDAEKIVHVNHLNPYQDILKVATWIVYQTLEKHSKYYENECDVSPKSDNTINNKNESED